MKLNKKLFGRSLYKIATILFLVGYNFAPAAFAIGDISKLEVKQDQSVSVTTEETSEVLNKVPVDTSEDIIKGGGVSDPEGIAKGEDLVKKEVWRFSGEKAITSTPVVVNEKYVFPGNSDVSVVFTKLPNTPSTLSMEEIILTDEEVKATGAVSKKAYDINTDMEDGTFEYDLTLPNLGVSGKVAYAEDRKELMTDLKEVTNKVVNVQGSLKVEGLNHFSIYIITNPPTQAPKVSSDGGANYSSSVTVTAGDVIKVKLNVEVGSFDYDSWKSTSYRIRDVMTKDFCINHDNHNQNGTYTETFDITAPPSVGTYNLDLKVYRNDSCQNNYSSSSYTLNNAIKVTSTPSLEPVANPVVPASCGLDIALVIDNSNSIDRNELNKMKDAMKAFVNSLKGTPTRFSVTKFGTNASVLQGFTSDTDSVIAAINGITPGDGGLAGGTNWEEGIRYARGTFAQGATENPDLMVFASDGNPTYPFCGGSATCDLDLNAAVIEANKAKQQGVRMLALGIGNELSVENLKKISGPRVNATTILESDVITANFDTMASKLRDLAIQTCGQKISVNKFVEENGQTNPGGAGWKFTVTGPTNTTLTTNAQGQDTTETLNIGTYSIVESNMLDGYSYKSAECKKNGVSIGNVIEKGIANIVIGYGDIVTCDFTNKKQEAELTLVKVVTNDNGGTAKVSDFILKAGDITFVSGTSQKVNTGTYSLSESGPDGYSPSNWECTGTGTQNGSDITLEDGQSAVCTITNDDIAPVLELVKTVTNDNGGTLDKSNWNLIADGPTPISGFGGVVSGDDFKAGTYTLSEVGKTGVDVSGYKAGNWSCEGATVINGNQVKVPLTGNVKCTINNDDIAPKLTVNKVVENGLFGEKTITAFPLFVGNTSVVSGEQNTFNAGSYVVSETNPEGSGYTSAISGACAEDGSVTLALGEEKECTITNTSIWSKITVKKLVLPSESTTKFAFTGALAGEIGNGGTISKVVLPGTYIVTETQPLTGWELTDLKCSNISSTTDLAAGVANYVVGNNEEVTCTYTNTKLGSISGYKYEDKDNDSTTVDDRSPVSGWTITLKDSNGNVIKTTTTKTDGSYEFTELLPGEYRVTEGTEIGWIVLVGDSHSVTLDAGENEENVNFVNVKLGSITVLKNVDGNGDGDLDDDVDKKGSTEWDWTLNGVKVGSTGSTKPELEPGTYIIKETGGLDNYHFVSLSCEGGKNITIDNDTATVVLESGEDVTCTYTNARNLGQLIVKKVVVNDNGGTLEAKDFSFKIDGGTPIKFEEDGQNEYTKYAGLSYNIVEVEANQRGYTTTYENCSNVTVPHNGTATCTITNTSTHGKIIIKKVVEPNTDGSTFEFTGDVEGRIGHNGEISKIVIPGTYSVSETVPTGWNLKDLTCEDPTRDSVQDSTDKNKVNINVSNNETVTCTFTNEKLGKISGYKYEDKNGNGTWDSGEVALSGWTINNGLGGTTTTNASGYYEFINLPVGNTYVVTEVNQEGWKQTSTNPSAITIVAGMDKQDVNFGNFKNVTINVTKDVVGIDGVTDVTDNTNFESLLNDADAKTIAERTTATYTIEDPGKYSVTESVNTDYDYIGCFLGDDAFSNYSVESGKTYNVVCKNKQKQATLIVNKSVIDSQNNDDGIFSEDEFDVILNGDTENPKQIADKEEGKVKAEFGGLQPGDYTFTETPKDGYIFDGCTNEGKVTLKSNERREVTCTNRVIDPILQIEKSNDREGVDQYAGNEVIYTIKVTAPSDKDAENKYILKNVVVSDIAPAGFKYILSTWTAKKNGVDMVIPEPTYNGTDRAQWMLGQMKEGDEIVLTYKTQISLLTDPGVYPDIAWVKGVSLSGTNVLGNVSTGADTPFVGTDVKVIEDDTPEEGEVLGASITLPNTGASTYLTLGALIMMILGLVSLLFKPFKKFKYALLASVVVFGMFLTVLPTKVSAVYEVLIAKIEKPVSPTIKKAFNIDFTAQDVYGVDIKVECYKNDVKFATFDKVNAGACPVTVDASGTYTFYVKAISTSGEVKSEDVTVEVIDKPLPVIDYSKAGNVLKFKTANDGKTVKVEIHRSEKSSYTANASTKIHEMVVAPNTEYTWTDATAEPGKTYYYALRSLDAFGNVSTMVSDPEVKVTQEATTTTPSATGTAVAGAETKTEGEVKGDTDEEIMEIKEVKEGKEKVQDGNEGEEKKEELTPNYKKYWYIWVPAILLVLGVGYIYVKRSKEE